jgi:tetratricopeptide (TPR) repeat protein
MATSKLLGASKAVALQERTRRLADAAGDDELRTRALIELAAYRLNTSEYPASLAFLEEAEAVLTRLGSRRDLRARVAGVRGLVEVELGQLDQAMAHGAEAVRLLEERGPPEDTLLAMEIARSSGAYQRARNYKRAIELLERAIAILERIHLGDHPTVADLLSTMGGLLIQSERREEAISVLQRSIQIRTVYFGANHPTLAGAMQNLGAAYRQLGRIDEAEAIATRALALMRQRKELDYMISAALSSLGSIKVMRETYADAVPLYEEALARLAAEGQADTPGAADVRFKLGRALWRGKIDRARARREASAARAISARAPDLAAHAAEIDGWLKSPDTAATPHFP